MAKARIMHIQGKEFRAKVKIIVSSPDKAKTILSKAEKKNI